MSRLGFLSRIGLSLFAPHRAAELLCAGGGGSFRDVLCLLPLRLLTGESTLFLEGDGRALLLGVLGALSIDLLVIMLGGVAMALFIGRRERLLRAGLTTDLAAQGWFAWLFIQVMTALVCVLIQRQPSPAFMKAVQTLGGLAWGVYFLIGFFVARRAAIRAEAQPQSPTTPPVAPRAPELPSPMRRAALGTGALFLGALTLLSIYDVSWLKRQRALRPDAGKLAPEVVVQQIDPTTGTGSEFRLSAERGHPVLLDFWATWCGPCKQSLPILEAIYKSQKPRGLRAIAINMSDDERTVRAFATRMKLEMPIGLDSGEASAAYHVSAIPHLVLVGSDGGIKRIFYGVHARQELEEAINTLGY